MRARFINWLYLLPLAIIALGALGSYIAWQLVNSTSQRAIRDAFEADVGRVVTAIERQSKQHEQLLRALASVAGTQDPVSTDLLRALVRDLSGDRSVTSLLRESARA
jgi:CHASE1-domain containing sensor protein